MIELERDVDHHLSTWSFMNKIALSSDSLLSKKFRIDVITLCLRAMRHNDKSPRDRIIMRLLVQQWRAWASKNGDEGRRSSVAVMQCTYILCPLPQAYFQPSFEIIGRSGECILHDYTALM